MTFCLFKTPHLRLRSLFVFKRLSAPLIQYVRVKMNGALTPTALSRWSCQQKVLPPVEAVKHIHIYDFDNTGKKPKLQPLKLSYLIRINKSSNRHSQTSKYGI